MISIVQIILGLSMLLLGRKLFWVYVGAIGFITATGWATANMQGQPEWLVLLIGLAAGAVGILLAVFLRTVGIGIAGFLSGGYLAATLMTLLGISGGKLDTIVFLVGGIVGVILFYGLFDWALVILSSASGAFILARQLPINQGIFWLVVVVFAAIGIGIQAQQLKE